MMPKVEVVAPGGRYPVVIGSGLAARLSSIEEVAGLLKGRRVALVSDENVFALHGGTILEGLAGAGAEVVVRSIMRPGEEHKNLTALSRIWDELIGAGLERRDMVVAFGGGVVGDVAGFAAATLLRGVDFMQVPTTLLAMVDSSVGGKTGIDHPKGKNLLGAFHQPVAVVSDTGFLRTLSRRENLSGMAEVIKAAVLDDEVLFGRLVHAGPAVLEDESALAAVIADSVGIKARIVGADERESGQRALLNLGHTLGHALENALGYGALTHGEAVAAGIYFAARLSCEVGELGGDDLALIERLLAAWGYKEWVEGADPHKVRSALAFDKKNSGGEPRWVLPTGIGTARWGVAVGWEEVDRLLLRTRGV